MLKMLKKSLLRMIIYKNKNYHFIYNRKLRSQPVPERLLQFKA